MAMVGALSRATILSRSNAGTLTFVGTIARYWNPVGAVISTLSFAGASTRVVHFRRRVISQKLLLQAGGWLELVAGGPLFLVEAKVLSFSGSAVRSLVTVTQISIAGVLSSVGALARNVCQYRSLAGSITSSGAISRLWVIIERGLASVVSFGGALSRTIDYKRTIESTLSIVALLAGLLHKFTRSISGTLAFRGVARRSSDFVKKGLSKLGFNLDAE